MVGAVLLLVSTGLLTGGGALLWADRTQRNDGFVWSDTTRIDTAQRRFLYDGNMDLKTPLTWKVYGETFRVA